MTENIIINEETEASLDDALLAETPAEAETTVVPYDDELTDILESLDRAETALENAIKAVGAATYRVEQYKYTSDDPILLADAVQEIYGILNDASADDHLKTADYFLEGIIRDVAPELSTEDLTDDDTEEDPEEDPEEEEFPTVLDGDTEPAPEVEPAPEAEPEVEPAPEAEPEADPEPESGTEAEVESKPEAGTQIQQKLKNILRAIRRILRKLLRITTVLDPDHQHHNHNHDHGSEHGK